MRSARFLPLITLVVLVSWLMMPAGADNIDAINYYNRAVELAYQGDYDKALTEIDHALQENRNFTLAWITKAGILNSMERFEEGLFASDEAIAIDPDNAYAWINRATSLNGLGRYEESIASSEKALSLDPESKEARENIQIAKEMIAKPAQTPEAGISPVIAIVAISGLTAVFFLERKR